MTPSHSDAELTRVCDTALNSLPYHERTPNYGELNIWIREAQTLARALKDRLPSATETQQADSCPPRQAAATARGGIGGELASLPPVEPAPEREARVPAETFPLSMYLREEMDERGWGINDMVAHMGGRPHGNELPLRHLSLRLCLSDNDVILDEKTAALISTALGTSAEYWLNLDKARRENKTRAAMPHTPGQPRMPTREELMQIATRWCNNDERPEALADALLAFMGRMR